MALQLSGVPFKLDAQDMGVPDWAGSLLKGLQVANKGAESIYKPRTMAEELLAQHLQNAINKPKADNAQEWYKAQLNHMLAQNGLIGAQTNEANLYTQNPLLKASGAAGLIGAEKYLAEHGGGQQGGWHDTGHGAGYDSGPSAPDSNSLYGDSESSTHPSSSHTGGSAPNLDAVIQSLPKERQDALNMTLTQAMGKGKQPTYAQRLHESIDAELNKAKTLNNYRQSLIDTAQKRASGGLTKDLLDAADVEQGFMPGTNRQVQISPEMQEQYKNEYALKIQKSISDADARKKVLFATNIDKTIESINKKDLTAFAGLNGAVKLKEQEFKSTTKPGSESEQYRRYLESANKAATLGKQVRQFYGDSIQPAMLDQINKLTNPATWRNNPAIAERLFDSFTQLLKKETDTYRSSLKSKKAYEGESSTKPIKMIWGPNGNLVRAE